MEQSERTFEITENDGLLDGPLLIRPKQTTDGIPIYHCYRDGVPVSELRQETSGEWVQLWGDLPTDAVAQVGAAIARQTA